MADMLKKIRWNRVLITLISVIFMGISVSVLKIVDCGMDPFTYMNVSIAEKIGWSLGNWQVLFNAMLFIPILIWGRKYIGIGTVFNMTLIGYTVDLCTWIWKRIGFVDLLSKQSWNVTMMLVGLAVFVISAATYMSAGTGTSPYDALPLMIQKRIPRIPFKVVRFSWDLAATMVGFLFSHRVGIVTLLMVLFLGQAVETVSKVFFGEDKELPRE